SQKEEERDCPAEEGFLQQRRPARREEAKSPSVDYILGFGFGDDLDCRWRCCTGGPPFNSIQSSAPALVTVMKDRLSHRPLRVLRSGRHRIHHTSSRTRRITESARRISVSTSVFCPAGLVLQPSSGPGWTVNSSARSTSALRSTASEHPRQMTQGVSMDELDDMTLRKECLPEALEEMYYFGDYDHDDTIDWYLDPDHSVHSYLSDYHRLVLKNGDGTRYLDWEKYCSWFTTYETDEEYLKYFEEISKKIKWIKRYMEFERGSPEVNMP
uniref:Uncharacterized protein n=1 Tax=Aegilops tauschii subsp. strangulata TaxID=200361 RepID=A0A452YQ46_AEGTS